MGQSARPLADRRTVAIQAVIRLLPTQTSLGPGFDRRVAAERIVDAVARALTDDNKYTLAMQRAEMIPATAVEETLEPRRARGRIVEGDEL